MFSLSATKATPSLGEGVEDGHDLTQRPAEPRELADDQAVAALQGIRQIVEPTALLGGLSGGGRFDEVVDADVVRRPDQPSPLQCNFARLWSVPLLRRGNGYRAPAPRAPALGFGAIPQRVRIPPGNCRSSRSQSSSPHNCRASLLRGTSVSPPGTLQLSDCPLSKSR